MKGTILRSYRVAIDVAGAYTGHEWASESCAGAEEAFEFAEQLLRAHKYFGPATLRIILGHAHTINVVREIPAVGSQDSASLRDTFPGDPK